MIKNPLANADVKTWVKSLGQEDSLGKEMATQSSILAGKFHGQRRLVGYSLWGREELDMTEAIEHTGIRGYSGVHPPPDRPGASYLNCLIYRHGTCPLSLPPSSSLSS